MYKTEMAVLTEVFPCFFVVCVAVQASGYCKGIISCPTVGIFGKLLVLCPAIINSCKYMRTWSRKLINNYKSTHRHTSVSISSTFS